MKVVINRHYCRRFSISKEGKKRLSELDSTLVIHDSDVECRSDVSYVDEHDIKFRSNVSLVQMVEELGDKANGSGSKLVVIEVPDDVELAIIDYDGVETIVRCGCSWPPLEFE